MGRTVLARGPPALVPARLELHGPNAGDLTAGGQSNCKTATDTGCGCDGQQRSPTSVGTLVNATHILDFASLPGIFVVPSNGTVAIRDLAVTGALLPASPYPLPATSFLALSAFKLPAATPTASTTPPPPLQLFNLLIATPSCAMLSLHMDFACRASPSPNFTMTPTSLTVHRFTTPTASLTNVTLTCTGAPAPTPCLAASASTAEGLLSAIQFLQLQAAAATAAAAAAAAFTGAPPPLHLFLCRDISLRPSSLTLNDSAVAPATSMPTVAILINANVRLIIAGSPAITAEQQQLQRQGAPLPDYTLLDLADAPGLLSLGPKAELHLRNLTLRNGPMGPPSQRPWSLLRGLMWAFDFPRLAVGSKSTRLALRSVRLELGCDELAFWAASLLPGGRGAVPAALRGSLCVDGASYFMQGVKGARVLESPGGGPPSLRIDSMTTWADTTAFDDLVLSPPAGGDGKCCAASACAAGPGRTRGGDGYGGDNGFDGDAVARPETSVPGAGAGSGAAAAPQPPPAPAAAECCPLCRLLLPEGVRGGGTAAANSSSSSGGGSSASDAEGGTIVNLYDSAFLYNKSFFTDLSSSQRSFPTHAVAWILRVERAGFYPLGSPAASYELRYDRRLPAVVTAPAALVGSLTQPMSLDLSRVPAAVQLRGDSASLTMRGVVLLGLPPAGHFPYPDPPPPSPPSTSPDFIPAVAVGAAAPAPAPALVPPGVSPPLSLTGLLPPRPAPLPPPASRRRRRALRQRMVHSPPTESSSSGRRSRSRSQGSSKQQAGSGSRRRLCQAGGEQPSDATVAAAPTQGLPVALANLTSCLWTLHFDRPAAVAATMAGATLPASGAAGADVGGNSPYTNSSGGNGTGVAGGSAGRPAGLPYAYLDSVVLLVPQPELDWLAAVLGNSAAAGSGDGTAPSAVMPAAGNTVVAGSSSGLGEQLAVLRTRSRLASASASLLAGQSLFGSGDVSGAASWVVSSLTFEELSWCGMLGRNVTLTSQPPAFLPNASIPPPLVLPPLPWVLPQPVPGAPPPASGLRPPAAPQSVEAPGFLPHLPPNSLLPPSSWPSQQQADGAISAHPAAQPSSPVATGPDEAAAGRAALPAGAVAGGAAAACTAFLAVLIALYVCHRRRQQQRERQKPSPDTAPAPAAVPEVTCQLARLPPTSHRPLVLWPQRRGGKPRAAATCAAAGTSSKSAASAASSVAVLTAQDAALQAALRRMHSAIHNQRLALLASAPTDPATIATIATATTAGTPPASATCASTYATSITSASLQYLRSGCSPIGATPPASTTLLDLPSAPHASCRGVTGSTGLTGSDGAYGASSACGAALQRPNAPAAAPSAPRRLRAGPAALAPIRPGVGGPSADPRVAQPWSSAGPGSDTGSSSHSLSNELGPDGCGSTSSFPFPAGAAV